MRLGDAVWAAILAGVVALFAAPATSAILLDLTARYPYPMGFAKFALLATMGELLVLRMNDGRWRLPRGAVAKAGVWGLVGFLVVLMFALFNSGVQAAGARGLLPLGTGWIRTFLTAFWTSATMNLTFGPMFMAAHRISDAFIEDRAAGGHRPFMEVVEGIDWRRFLTFVVGRTLPFFWIPAHTATFMLPAEYRVLVAALLSIALGVVLTWGKRKGKKA